MIFPGSECDNVNNVGWADKRLQSSQHVVCDAFEYKAVPFMLIEHDDYIANYLNRTT